MNCVLSLSAYYHDSAAALLADGQTVAAAQEQRFTRRRHDAQFQVQAIGCCLREAGIGLRDLKYVVLYDQPVMKLDRLLKTYLSYAPKGL